MNDLQGDLRSEYVDAKNIRHRVDHQTLPVVNRERLVEDILQALTSGGKLHRT